MVGSGQLVEEVILFMDLFAKAMPRLLVLLLWENTDDEEGQEERKNRNDQHGANTLRKDGNKGTGRTRGRKRVCV